MTNLFEGIPSTLREEAVETLAASGSVRIERIVSQGHSSAEGFWYDQPQDEFVVLLRGAARLRFEDESDAIEMKSGDWIKIPAHRRHRVEWTTLAEQSVWLAVHYDE